VLVKTGWLRLVREGKGLRPVLAIPAAVQETLIEELKAEFSMARHKGEFLMKRLLDLLVYNPYIDNARPDFLINPLTGEPLELDRYFPDGAGFEHNGTQHYATTDLYDDAEALKQAQSRDLMKSGLCQKAGVALVTVRAEDLSIEGIRRLLPPCLKRNVVDEKGPYAVALDLLCAAYRKKVARSARIGGSAEVTRSAAR
jgi:hypothetical protein